MTDFMNIKAFLRRSLIKDSMKLASSNVLMFLLPLVVTPILSRIYLPEDFGDWGVFSSVLSIATVILFYCYEYTIIKAEEKQFPRATSLCFICGSFNVLLLFLFFYISRAIGLEWFVNFPSFSYLIIYMLVTVVLTITQNVANRYELYWVMTFGNALCGLLQAGLRILFGITPILDNGLIAGTVYAQLITCLFFLIYTGKYFNSSFWKSVSIPSIKNFAKEQKKFPLYDAPASLLAFGALCLPIIILSSFFAKSDIGCYSMITQLLLMPITFVGSAIGRVYYKQISIEGSGMEQIASASREVLKITTILAFIPALFLAVGGDFLIRLFLGERWDTASGVALCLAIWSIPSILSQPLVPIFRRTNRQNIMLRFNMLYFCLGIGSLLITCTLSLPLYYCLAIYGVSASTAKFALFAGILKTANVSLSTVFPNYLRIIYIVTIALLVYRLIGLL